MLGIVGLSIIVFLLWVFFRRPAANNTIYLDEGKESVVFRSAGYRIAAKPDRIVQGANNHVVPHEFKSRKHGIASRDVIQIKTAAIAIRDSGYQVKEAVLEIGSGKQYRIDVEPTDVLMQGEIGTLIGVVRAIKRGEVPKATPGKKACKGCSYRKVCPYTH